MTLRLKISNIEPGSQYDALITDTYDKVLTVIKPGGSADFWVHSAKSLVIQERPTEKNGEAGASPS